MPSWSPIDSRYDARYSFKFCQTVGLSGSNADFICTGTNDHLVIQAALNAVHTIGYGWVLLLPGIYYLNGQITVYPQTLLMGSGMGVTILNATGWATNGAPVFVNTGSGNADYTFKDFSCIGRFTPGTGTTYATSGQFGFIVSQARRVVFDQVYFEGFYDATLIGSKQSAPYNDSLAALNIKQVVFNNCYCYNCVGGLQGYAQESIIWNANHFENIGDDACAFLGAAGNNPRSAKAVMSNNIFKNGVPLNANGVPGVGIFAKVDGAGFGPDNITQVEITGNVVEGAYHGLYLANCSRVGLNGNDISNTTLSAVYMSGGNKVITATGNTIVRANMAADANHASILGVAVDDLTLTGNQIHGDGVAGREGITLQGMYNRAQVEGNKINNCFGHSGIYAETVTEGIFTGNIISGPSARGITVSGSRAIVALNEFNGAFTSGVLVTPSLTYATIKNNIGLNPELQVDLGSISGAVSIDRVNGDVFTATQTSNITLTLVAGKVKGDQLTLKLTTGVFTQAWPSNLKLAGGACAMTGTSILVARWDGVNWVEVSRSLNVS